MNHQKFLNEWLGKFYREQGIQYSECVALAKLYSKEVLGISLPSFGGSARSGWENLSNTFNLKYWKRIKNTPKNVPSQGSIVFFDIGPYGHVGIVNTADINSLTICEQNATGKPGDVPGDEIKLSLYKYTKCLGWYTLLIPQAIADGVNPGIVEEYHNAPNPAPMLPPNHFKTIANYNQTISGECTFFAIGGCITYNTGKVFKNTLLHNYWLTYCSPADPSYPLMATARIMAKDYSMNLEVLKGFEAEQILDKGYAMAITIVAPTDMIIDGIKDGVIDGDYAPDISKSHAIMLIKENGKYFLINSLGKFAKPPTHNKYEITKEQLTKIQKGSSFYFLYS